MRLLILFILTSCTTMPQPEQQAQEVKEYRDIQRAYWTESGVKDGWDWGLPPATKPYDLAWVKFGDDPKAVFPGKRMVEVESHWRNIEPTEGVYDWSTAKLAIEEAAKNGFGVEFHLKGATWEINKLKNGKWEVSDGSTPRWLGKKVGKVKEDQMSDTTTYQITNLDIYDPTYHKAYDKLLASLKQSGIPQMPNIAIVYVHNKSKSKGEEGNVPNGPEADVFNKRLESWADVWGEKVSKLVYVGTWGSTLKKSYELGMGQRSGFVEDYLAGINNSDLCQGLTKEGYLTTVDEACPVLDGRAFGDENEEYAKSWTGRFGDYESFPHRYRESMLRVLQMRRNFLWTAPFALDPDLMSYVALSMGYTASTSVDAWVYLRESYLEGGKPVKNFERWITQRDRVGAETTPVEKVTVPKAMGNRDKTKLYDFTARSAKQKMVFSLDKKFMAPGIPTDVVVKVTYKDQAGGQWALNLPSGCSKQIVTGGSNKLLTATFACPKVVFGSSTEDFSIDVSTGEAVVSMVRVIKKPVKKPC